MRSSKGTDDFVVFLSTVAYLRNGKRSTRLSEVLKDIRPTVEEAVVASIVRLSKEKREARSFGD